MVLVEVDGMPVDVPAGTPVKEVLEALGVHFVAFPSEGGIFMPCQTGGCWSCSLDIDGELRPICISDAQEGMRIKTDAASLTPKRLVGGFIAHRVGGVGTHGGSMETVSRWRASLEAAIFAAHNARTGALPTWARASRSLLRRQRGR
jgi:hypothetical protein